MGNRGSQCSPPAGLLQYKAPSPPLSTLKLLLTMATASSSYYAMTTQPGEWSTYVLDIGHRRSVRVRSFPEGMTIHRPDVEASDLRKYSITLGCGSVKVMNKFFDEIRRAVAECKSEQMTEEFFLPLGDMIFLQIKPDYKCLTIRQFYKRKDDPTPLPGIPGVSLKFQEFINLDPEWTELLDCVRYENAEICQFEHPKNHKICQKCF